MCARGCSRGAVKVEVNVANEGRWKTCATLKVEPGQTLEHKSPDAYGAHWACLAAAADCTASEIIFDE